MIKALSECARALIRLHLGDMEAAVHAEGSWKVQLDCNGVDDFADSKWSDPSGLQACHRLEVFCRKEYIIANFEA